MKPWPHKWLRCCAFEARRWKVMGSNPNAPVSHTFGIFVVFLESCETLLEYGLGYFRKIHTEDTQSGAYKPGVDSTVTK